MTAAVSPLRRLSRPLLEFLGTEAAGGVVLLAATVAALVWANGPWADSYERVWEAGRALTLGPFALPPDLRHWVNEGLMVLFFFVVGLEIKPELVTGSCATPVRPPCRCWPRWAGWWCRHCST